MDGYLLGHGDRSRNCLLPNAIALSERGRWPGFAGSELIASALAGGAVLWVYHGRALGMILFVFVPLMTLLLFIGAFAVGILMGDFEP